MTEILDNTHVMDTEQMSAVVAEANRALHVYTIGPDTYIAYDEEDAWRCLEEQTGLKNGDPDVEDDEPILISDDKALKVFDEEGGPEPLVFTAAEWCAREGRGFLCSTEY